MNISHNLLDEIRSGAFKYCENMTVLDLSHNRLKRIASDAFDKTSYTTELRLMYNQVGNDAFTMNLNFILQFDIKLMILNTNSF